METFLVLGATFGLTGVALGAFGSHALGVKLPPERIATFETGIRYQMWHALALFLIVLVDAWEPMSGARRSTWYPSAVERRSCLRPGGRSRPGSSCSRAVCTRSP